MNRYATIIGGGILAAIVILIVLGILNSPIREMRKSFQYQLEQIVVPEMQFGDAENPEFDRWQMAIAAQPKLWEPLYKPQAQAAPPPNLAQQLNGVLPTRSGIGTGDSRKVQIQVDGQSNWYAVGDQIKGCVVKEISDTTVLFTVTQDGQEYGIALPRR